MNARTFARVAGSCGAAVSCAILAASTASAAFSTIGRLRAAIQTPPTSVDRTQNTETEHEDSEFLVGEHHNSLYAHYLVSLPWGRMDAQVEADGGNLPPGGIYYQWANGLVELSLVERIDFTVPAGSYPDGVTVTLDAAILGGLEAYGGASALPTADANLHFWFFLDFDHGGIDRSYGPIESGDPPLDADEDFELVLNLLHPGAHIDQEITLYGTINASLATTAVFPSFSEASGNAAAHLDVRVLSLEASDPNVTWTSESGVFLVPEPSRPLVLGTSALLSLGLAALRRTPGHA